MIEFDVMVRDRDNGKEKFGRTFQDIDKAKEYYLQMIKEFGKKRVVFYEVERKFVYEV